MLSSVAVRILEVWNAVNLLRTSFPIKILRQIYMYAASLPLRLRYHSPRAMKGALVGLVSQSRA
jgi:hypothetical protein